MLDTYGIISVLRLTTSASRLTTLTPCYTIHKPALLARGESQQPPRRNRAGFVFSSEEQMRHCPKCKLTKPVDEFTKNRSRPDGIGSWCKACTNASSRRHYEANKDKLRVNARAAYWRTPDARRAASRLFAINHPEKRRTYRKEYYKANSEHASEYSKQWRLANPEYARVTYQEWARKNYDRIVVGNARRRALEAAAPGVFTAREWRQLKEHYQYTCLRCKKTEPTIKLTIDHVIPLSKGGWNAVENIQPLCKPCNSGKKDRAVDYRSEPRP